MSGVTLTQRQQDMLDFIADYTRTHGYCPTIREIAEAFGIKSPNGVICTLKALEKKGKLHREHSLSRSITLTEGDYRDARIQRLVSYIEGHITSQGHTLGCRCEHPECVRRMEILQ